jgi:hypothetical protein
MRTQFEVVGDYHRNISAFVKSQLKKFHRIAQNGIGAEGVKFLFSEDC